MALENFATERRHAGGQTEATYRTAGGTGDCKAKAPMLDNMYAMSVLGETHYCQHVCAHFGAIQFCG